MCRKRCHMVSNTSEDVSETVLMLCGGITKFVGNAVFSCLAAQSRAVTVVRMFLLRERIERELLRYREELGTDESLCSEEYGE